MMQVSGGATCLSQTIIHGDEITKVGGERWQLSVQRNLTVFDIRFSGVVSDGVCSMFWMVSVNAT